MPCWVTGIDLHGFPALKRHLIGAAGVCVPGIAGIDDGAGGLFPLQRGGSEGAQTEDDRKYCTQRGSKHIGIE